MGYAAIPWQHQTALFKPPPFYTNLRALPSTDSTNNSHESTPTVHPISNLSVSDRATENLVLIVRFRVFTCELGIYRGPKATACLKAWSSKGLV